MSNPLFGALKTDSLEETRDSLGGYSPLDTDIYTGKVKLAYATKSTGGANALNIVVDIGGKDYRETLWITNKNGDNYYLNKQDQSKKVALPGFTIADDLCLATLGTPLAEQLFEEKVVKLYSADTKKEEPTTVQMLVAILGQEVSLGIVKSTVNKTVKQGEEYVPTAETKEENHIDKVFHTETKKTLAEARAGAEEATFWDSWLKRNKGITRDKTDKTGATGAAGRPAGGAAKSGPPVAGATKAPQKSLFGNKS